MGVAYKGIRVYMDHYYYGDDTFTDAQITPMTTQIQTIIVEGLKGILAPLLYQAFFEIGVAISSPFSSPEAGIAIARLITNLENELESNNKIATAPPSWSAPRFKQPS